MCSHDRGGYRAARGRAASAHAAGCVVTPAVRIYRDGRGEWQTHAVSLNYSRPARLEDACAKVREGRTVFVAPEDAENVLEAAKGAGRGETVS